MKNLQMTHTPNVEIVYNKVQDLITMIDSARCGDYETFKNFNSEIALQDFFNLQPIIRYTLKKTRDYTAFSVYVYIKQYMKDSDERDIMKILDKCPEFRIRYFSLTEEYRKLIQDAFKFFPALNELILFENLDVRFSSLKLEKNEAKEIAKTAEAVRVG